ncbi:hypothetical protein [Legionella genomosp. 1]|uniref:hypothetical protein n=1 Tax=Legionella genomosp. 1 TaxID=1093625 RepID=UPI001054858E|nr:hypothetical protein [Legionella genomosp. 1]
MLWDKAIIIQSLKNLAGKSDLEIKACLRELLARRANYTQREPFNYFCYPGYPLNELCVEIAHLIAEKEEAVCGVLLGRSEDLLCWPVYSLKDETEEKVNGEGRFNPRHFFLNANGQLVPVREIYERSVSHPEKLFSKDPAVRFPSVSEWDIKVLYSIAGNEGNNYLKQAEIYFYQDNSLAAKLRELARELHESSMVGKGTNALANQAMAKRAAIQFHHYWKSLPPNPEIDNLSTKTAYLEDATLKDYLLAVMMRFVDPDQFTEAERQQFNALNPFGGPKITPCAFEISQALNLFVDRYPLLKTVILMGEEQQTDNLQSLMESALTSLSSRKLYVDNGINCPRAMKRLYSREVIANPLLSMEEKSNMAAELVIDFETLFDMVFPYRETRKQEETAEKLYKEFLSSVSAKLKSVSVDEYSYETIARLLNNYTESEQIEILKFLAPRWKEVCTSSLSINTLERHLRGASANLFRELLAESLLGSCRTLSEGLAIVHQYDGATSFLSSFILLLIKKFPSQFSKSEAINELIVQKNSQFLKHFFNLVIKNPADWFVNEEEFSQFINQLNTVLGENELSALVSNHQFNQSELDFILYSISIKASYSSIFPFSHSASNVLRKWILQFKSLTGFLKQFSAQQSALRDWLVDYCSIDDIVSDKSDLLASIELLSDQESISKLFRFWAMKKLLLNITAAELQNIDLTVDKVNYLFNLWLEPRIRDAKTFEEVAGFLQEMPLATRPVKTWVRHLPESLVNQQDSFIRMATEFEGAKEMLDYHGRHINCFSWLILSLEMVKPAERVSSLGHLLGTLKKGYLIDNEEKYARLSALIPDLPSTISTQLEKTLHAVSKMDEPIDIHSILKEILEEIKDCELRDKAMFTSKFKFFSFISRNRAMHRSTNVNLISEITQLSMNPSTSQQSVISYFEALLQKPGMMNYHDWVLKSVLPRLNPVKYLISELIYLADKNSDTGFHKRSFNQMFTDQSDRSFFAYELRRFQNKGSCKLSGIVSDLQTLLEASKWQFNCFAMLKEAESILHRYKSHEFPSLTNLANAERYRPSQHANSRDELQTQFCK